MLISLNALLIHIKDKDYIYQVCSIYRYSYNVVFTYVHSIQNIYLDDT